MIFSIWSSGMFMLLDLIACFSSSALISPVPSLSISWKSFLSSSIVF